MPKGDCISILSALGIIGFNSLKRAHLNLVELKWPIWKLFWLDNGPMALKIDMQSPFRIKSHMAFEPFDPKNIGLAY